MKSVLCILVGALYLIASSDTSACKPIAGVSFSVVTQSAFDERQQAEIEYTVHGESINEPFVWSLRITVQDKVVLELLHDSPESDGPFKDPGYSYGCLGFNQCKRHWYFNQLPEAIERIIETSPASGEIAEWEVATMKSLASDFLKERGVSEEQTLQVLDEMLELRKLGFVAVAPPMTPNQSDALFMYVPSLGYFVPYLDD